MSDRTLKQFEGMTIGQLRKLTEEHKRLSRELQYLKTKYPKAKEEVEGDRFNIDKFLSEC